MNEKQKKHTHPKDIAEKLNKLKDKDFHNRFEHLIDNEEASFIGDVFSYLEPEQLKKHFDLHKVDRYAKILNKMDPDELAEITRELGDDKKSELILNLDANLAAKVKELLSYKIENASGVMEKEFFHIRGKLTVKVARQYLTEQAHIIKNINYLYVVDDEERLEGVIGLKELLIANDEEIVKDIMRTDVKYVTIKDSLMKAAEIIKDYDFYFIPVVDLDKKIKGIVKVEEVLDYYVESSDDQIEQIIGLEIEEEHQSVITEVFQRAPALIILLLFSLFNSRIYGSFESAVSNPSIVLFQALIAGMTGNVATQTLGLSIKLISTNMLQGKTKKEIFRYALRQITIYLGVSTVIGVILTIVVGIIIGQRDVAIALTLSMFISFTIAAFLGVIIPIIIDKLKFNTAIASGPIISTLNDLISISVYFTIAGLIVG